MDLYLIRQVVLPCFERKLANKVKALLISISSYLKFIAVVFIFVEEKWSDEDDATTQERNCGESEEEGELVSAVAADFGY